MLSPMMTVFVLAVLWLIVVVPMIFRRNDERRRERSVDGFGKAMRALGRRAHATVRTTRAEVFVPSARRTASRRRRRRRVSTRRPVPAAQEALMYPVDRSPRCPRPARQMMARRRRSLGILGRRRDRARPDRLARSAASMWLLAAPFVLGLAGYLWFLRIQALRDRDRRENRQLRAARAAAQHRRHDAHRRDVDAAFERAGRVGRAHRRRRHRAAQHGHHRPHRPVQRGAGRGRPRSAARR